MPGALCIHGHFYQPPRENPWLQAVPTQPSAAPFHDWNDRIHHECYRANTAARVVDGSGRVRRVLNNFARISFDVGPTLLSWMAEHAPDELAAIQAADRAAVARFGRGGAVAQGYNHTILPLSTDRDKRTQVRWGLADFRHRFGREADGLWLPECAVDTPSLEVLAEHGVRFTILAPHQVAAVCGPEGGWRPCDANGPDPRRPYQIDLPSGRSIAVFVYDGPVSRAVAFEHLLDNGDRFAERLRVLPAAPDHLGNIATDGESYGHHHRFGEMALAWALERLDADPEIELAPYAAWLDRHPPAWKARIHENSSWSCAHGVERWRSACGCGAAVETLGWRAPLRASFDRLAARLDALFESRGAEVLIDPWAARDAWIEVILQPEHRDLFFATHLRPGASAPLGGALLEMQRHRMLMYTSCGWFFDDVDRLEPQRDLAYAWRAAMLAEDLGAEGIRDSLIHDLRQVRSARPGGRDAATLIREEILPEVFDGLRAAAHHAAVRRIHREERWYNFQIRDIEVHCRAGAEVARVVVVERTTGREWPVLTASYAVPGVWKAEALPDDGEDVVALLDLYLAEPQIVRARAAFSITGTADLLDADRRRVERAAAEHLDRTLDELGRAWQVWAPLLPDAAAADAPVAVTAAAWAARHRELEDLLAHPGPINANRALELASAVAGAPRVGRLAEAAGRGLLALTAALDPSRPGTLEALCARVALARKIGLSLDLFATQGAVVTLLNDRRTRSAAWSRGRATSRQVLLVDPG